MTTPAAMNASEACDTPTYMGRLKSIFSSWKRSLPIFRSTSQACEVQSVQIEDYGPGYPRFSALIGAHDSFHICRRFSRLRARLLLLKQDRLSLLEKQLEKIDREETTVLFLGSSRSDSNAERSSVLKDIDTALANYDEFVERDRRMLGYETAKPRDVLSLQNWVAGNACLAREETAYLTHCKELLSVAPSDDGVVTRLETCVEEVLIQSRKGRHRDPYHDISRDSNVHIFSVFFIKQATRTLIASIITIILLVPIVICNFLSGGTARIAVIVVATVLFIAILSGLTKARTIEMLVAGATYAAVLTVFISGTSSSTS